MRKMKADSLPDLVTIAARLGLRPAPEALLRPNVRSIFPLCRSLSRLR